ncbi:MAG: hypothetical protein GY863_15845 [bacterium]|nr:hypothetical protein [bacterium]
MAVNSIGMQGMHGGFGPRGMSGRLGPLGKAFQVDPANLSETEMAEMRDFGKMVREGIRSSNFDAAAIAEQAPEVLQSHAQESGITVEDTLNGLYNKIMEKKNGMEGKPPAGKGNMQRMRGGKAGRSPLMNMLQIDRSQLSEEESTELKEFENSVREAIMSGEFDAAALVENAPDFIRNAAEESGIDLEDVLTNMYNKITEMQSNRVNGAGYFSGMTALNGDMEYLKDMFV